MNDADVRNMIITKFVGVPKEDLILALAVTGNTPEQKAEIQAAIDALGNDGDPKTEVKPTDFGTPTRKVRPRTRFGYLDGDNKFVAGVLEVKGTSKSAKGRSVIIDCITASGEEITLVQYVKGRNGGDLTWQFAEVADENGDHIKGANFIKVSYDVLLAGKTTREIDDTLSYDTWKNAKRNDEFYSLNTITTGTKYAKFFEREEAMYLETQKAEAIAQVKEKAKDANLARMKKIADDEGLDIEKMVVSAFAGSMA